jgi:hypothetical protein
MMHEQERTSDQILVSVSAEELRLLLGTLNEALNGPYAIPSDEWIDLVGQPPERVASLLGQIGAILER